MALLPYIIDELLDVPSQRSNFGLGIYPSELWETPRTYMSLQPLLNKLGYDLNNADLIENKTHIGKDGFQVCLDVQHFAPNEISVKTVENSIIVEAKHEERKDEHGYVSRQFERRYELPPEINVKDVVSTISSDGVLTIKAPPATPALEGKVRHIELQHTGPARLNVEKEAKDEKDGNCKKKEGKICKNM